MISHVNRLPSPFLFRKNADKTKQLNFLTFDPTFQLIMLPGFGPFYVKILALSLMVKGVNNALKQGLDTKRILPYDDNCQCMQNHPQAIHKHTITTKDYPYSKKLRIADQFNTVLNSFSDAFKMYVERKEYFYKTFNQELQECAQDSYRVLAKQAIQDAWLHSQYYSQPNKAFKYLTDYYEAIKNAQKEIHQRARFEVKLMEAYLLSKKNDDLHAYHILKQLPKNTCNPPLTPKEQKWAINTLIHLGFDKTLSDDLHMHEAFYWMLLEAKRVLKKLDDTKKSASDIVKETFHDKPAAVHVLNFLKYTKNNFLLFKKYNLLSKLSCYRELSQLEESPRFFNLSMLQKLHRDFITTPVDFPLTKENQDFYEAAAIAEASLNAIRLISKQDHPTKKLAAFLNQNTKDDLKWIENAPSLPFDRSVLLIDSESKTLSQSQKIMDQISKNYHKQFYFGILHCGLDKAYQLKTKTSDSDTISKIKDRLTAILKPSSTRRILIFLKGESYSLTQRAVNELPDQLSSKVHLAAFSSLSAEQNLSDCTFDHYISQTDRLALLSHELFNPKYNDFHFLNSHASDNKDINLFNNNFYNSKAINLLESFINKDLVELKKS